MDEKIYEKAVKLLSIRMHTTGELLDKLLRKGFKRIDILPILKELEEHKFLDDQKFAEIFVENMKRYKDFGFYGIKAKLLARRIPSDMAEHALAQFFSLADEEALAAKLVSKLKRQKRDTFEKLTRSLQGRGFRAEVIRKTLK